MKSSFIYAFMIAAAVLLALVSHSNAADSRSAFRLQSAGERWGSSRVWSRFNADRRSFRFNGTNNRSCWNGSARGYRIFSSPQANRGSSIRSNLPASQRTVRRSYGTAARYSSRQRIISYRHYRSAGQAQRGVTIGVRR